MNALLLAAKILGVHCRMPEGPLSSVVIISTFRNGAAQTIRVLLEGQADINAKAATDGSYTVRP